MEENDDFEFKTRAKSLAKDVQFKVIILGLAAVGKSSITIKFVMSIFPDEYIPTLQDTHRKSFIVDDKITSLEILDTAGMEEYQMMQDIWIKEGNGFILVYSVSDPDSLEDLKRVYQRIELHRKEDKYLPPIFIVGNKVDLPQDKQKVTKEIGEEFVQKLSKKNCFHMEVSAKSGYNIENLFSECVRKMRQQIEQQKSKNKRGSAGSLDKKKKKKKKKWYQCTLI